MSVSVARAEAPAPHQVAVTLPVAGGVRGRLHLPATETAGSGLGVALIGPLGWGDEASDRPRREWAERLARAGHAALRLDLPGTGDSAGGPRDEALPEAWQAAIEAAASALRDTVGARAVAAIALGSSGLLAASARGYDALVLWATPATGRAAVRELRAFARIESAQTGERLDDLPDGEIHNGGFVLTAATTAALAALPDPAPHATRVLLLGRDGVGPADRLAAALTGTGTTVEQDAGIGWATLTAPPQQAVLPPETADRVERFLAAATPDTPFRTPPADADLTVGQTAERIVTFARTETAGVVAAPTDGVVRGVVVLLNAGAIRHIGPNRMWVEAARRWGPDGIATVRLDLPGTGDAGGPASPYADDLALYDDALVEQVRAVLDALPALGLPSRFVLAGLCSGAYMSLHAALADERVRAAVLLNPRLLFWDRAAPSRYELRRAAAVIRPGGLARLRAAEHPGRRLVTLAAELPALAANRLRRGEPAGDRLSAALTRLAERDQRLTIAFSRGDEPLRDEFDRDSTWPLLRAGGADLRDLPLTGHTFKGLAAQRAVHALLDEQVAAVFDPPGVT